MADTGLFTYNEQEHKGFYKGKLIPSITQLVALLFPMSDNIKKEVLENACDRGTKVHNDIDNTLSGLQDTCETQEGKNFMKLTESLGLTTLSSEGLLLYEDREGNIIAYGHYDQLWVATQYIVVRDGKLTTTDLPLETDTILYHQTNTILSDTKTISQFVDKKVETQLNLYSIGKELIKGRLEEIEVDNLIGIWVRDDKAQIRPLSLWDKDFTYNFLLKLVREWNEQNKGE